MLVHDDVHKKWLKRIAILFFLFFSNPFIIDNIWNNYQAKPVDLKAGSNYDVGILLGGMAGYDVGLQKGFFGPAADRFIQAARLYHTGHIRKILVSGGNAMMVNKKGYNEADFVAENLQQMGIPGKDIIIEKNARNTIENAAFSKLLLDSAGSSSSLLITSAIHMPRAMKIFTKAGINATPFPGNYRVLPVDTEFSWGSLIPTQEAFSKWTLILKEWVGLVRLAN